VPHYRLAAFAYAVFASLALAGCSNQSPVAPSDDRVPSFAQGASGTYVLTVVVAGLGAQLQAYVTDASGTPAQTGTAVFQYCRSRGAPAPAAECTSGLGRWAFWGRAGIIADGQFEGYALMAYHLAPAPGTTIGFRFRYSGQGSGIANGTSLPVDFSW
jgi:hypothetical protein